MAIKQKKVKVKVSRTFHVGSVDSDYYYKGEEYTIDEELAKYAIGNELAVEVKAPAKDAE